MLYCISEKWMKMWNEKLVVSPAPPISWSSWFGSWGSAMKNIGNYSKWLINFDWNKSSDYSSQFRESDWLIIAAESRIGADRVSESIEIDRSSIVPIKSLWS